MTDAPGAGLSEEQRLSQRLFGAQARKREADDTLHEADDSEVRAPRD